MGRTLVCFLAVLTSVISLSAREPERSFLSAQEIANLRAGLNATSEVVGISEILSTRIRQPVTSVSSSFFFKQLLSEKSQIILERRKYGPLVPLDPSLSIEQYQRKINTEKAGQCFRILNPTEGAMEELLNTIVFEFVGKAQEEDAAVPAVLRSNLDPIIKRISDHLDRAPTNRAGASLQTLLGGLRDVGFRNNRVRVLRFSRPGISLSLSSLISLRSGEDAAFVELQDCLVTYLRDQRELFSARMIQIDQGRDFVVSARLFGQFGLGNRVRLPLDWSELSDPRHREAARLQFFLEGNQFSDRTNEKSFLVKRLSRIQDSLVFLEGRLKNAKLIHDLTAELSLEQLDFLIDLMIQLNRDVLPTANAVALTGDLAKQALRGSAMEDFFFQRQTHRDLVTLSASLQEERKKREARRADLEAIRNQ